MPLGQGHRAGSASCLARSQSRPPRQGQREAQHRAPGVFPTAWARPRCCSHPLGIATAAVLLPPHPGRWKGGCHDKKRAPSCLPAASNQAGGECAAPPLKGEGMDGARPAPCELGA